MQKSISFLSFFSPLGFVISVFYYWRLRDNPIPLTKDAKFLMSSVIPQGWGFSAKIRVILRSDYMRMEMPAPRSDGPI